MLSKPRELSELLMEIADELAETYPTNAYSQNGRSGLQVMRAM
jgi:hypothetical protein